MAGENAGCTFFSTTDVLDVRRKLAGGELQDRADTIRGITEAIRKLEELTSESTILLTRGALESADVRFAAFRVQTLSLFFEYACQWLLRFSKGNGEETHHRFLTALGWEVGFTYARQLLSRLYDAKELPGDLWALLELWAHFENDTGSGITKVEPRGDLSFQVILEENPLGFFYTKSDSHSNCQFYTAYYDSLVSEFSLARGRMAREFFTDFSPSHSTVLSVRENPLKNRCVFEVTLKPEELGDSFDLLHDAGRAFDRKELATAIQKGRTALEKAQSGKLPELSGDPKLWKSFQQVLDKFEFNLMRDAYQKASAFVHGKSRQKKAIHESEFAETYRHLRYICLLIERNQPPTSGPAVAPIDEGN